MTTSTYHGLLNHLVKANIAALIMDKNGRVHHYNQLCTPFQTKEQPLYWKDFCLNGQQQWPQAGDYAFYWPSVGQTSMAQIALTVLHDSGLCLVLFLTLAKQQRPTSAFTSRAALAARLTPQTLGFILYAPYLKHCFWSEQAAALHDEQAPYYSRLTLSQLLKWYPYAQRDRLLYALLECERSQTPQQVSLPIAHSNKLIRYLWLSLPINGKPLTCAFIRPVGKVTSRGELKQQGRQQKMANYRLSVVD